MRVIKECPNCGLRHTGNCEVWKDDSSITKSKRLKRELLELAEAYHRHVQNFINPFDRICSNCGKELNSCDSCGSCGAPNGTCFDTIVGSTCSSCLGCGEPATSDPRERWKDPTKENDIREERQSHSKDDKGG